MELESERVFDQWHWRYRERYVLADGKEAFIQSQLFKTPEEAIRFKPFVERDFRRWREEASRELRDARQKT